VTALKPKHDTVSIVENRFHSLKATNVKKQILLLGFNNALSNRVYERKTNCSATFLVVKKTIQTKRWLERPIDFHITLFLYEIHHHFDSTNL